MPPSEDDNACPAEYKELLSLLKCPAEHVDLMRDATEVLEQISLKAGFIDKLLAIFCDENGQSSARVRAATHLKYQIRYLWSSEKQSARQQAVMSDAEKKLIRKAVIGEFMKDSPCSKKMESAIAVMTAFDFIRRQWSYLPPTLCEVMDRGESSSWAPALTILERFLRSVDLRKHESERAEIQRFLKSMCPRMLERYRRIAKTVTVSSLLNQTLILKALCSITLTSLNKEVMNETELLEWMNILHSIIDREMPSRIRTGSAQEKNLWWKCKKWAVRVIDLIYVNYVHADHPLVSNNRLQKVFSEQISSSTISSLKGLLQKYLNGEHVDNRVLQISFQHLANICPCSSSWTRIKPNVEDVYRDAIFQALTPTAFHRLFFDKEPVQYIQREYDAYRFLVDPAVSAAGFLKAICLHQDQLLPMFQFTVASLESLTGDAKEAALLFLGYIGDVAPSSVKLDDMKLIINERLLPLISDKAHARIKARACWAIGRLANLVIHTPDGIPLIQDALYNCILRDSSLPVRVEAVIASDALIEYGVIRMKCRTATLPPLFVAVVDIIRKTGMEEPVAALRRLLRIFNLTLFGDKVKLIRDLIDVYKDMVTSMNEGGVDVWSTVSGVIGCVNVIAVHSREFDSTYYNIVAECLRIPYDVFLNRYCALYEDSFNLIRSTIFKDVLECHWKALYFVYRAVIVHEGVIFPMMMPMLHKFCVTAKVSLLEREYRLHIIYQLIARTLRDPDQTTVAYVQAAKLLECIVIEYPGLLNHCIEHFVFLCLEMQKKYYYFEKRAKIMNSVLLIACLTENRPVILNKLEDWGDSIKDGLSQLAEFLLCSGSDFRGIHDRRMYIAGWLFLFRCPRAFRPKIVQEQLKKIIEEMMKVFEALDRTRKGLNAPHVNFRSPGTASPSSDEDTYKEDFYNEFARNCDHSSLPTKIRCREFLEDLFPSSIDCESVDFDEYALFYNACASLQTEDSAILKELLDTSSIPEHQRAYFEECKKICNQRYARLDKNDVTGGSYMFGTTDMFNFGSKKKSAKQ
ncbi:hypothetical protein AB6A40_002471 [Gnathostoma spinigerum]|uniref:Importin N-terminal domain-containing protein n=1 Tax=Gnathostoma spinigerum TaxID=75299 RepID=A0ABD6E8Y2_9BILA